METEQQIEESRSIMEAAIRKSFPDQAAEIIPTVKWDRLNGCWFFKRWGMYIGIERDGYIHS